MSGPVPEPHVEVGTSRREWIALLAGPSLWWGHFMAVYLLGEVACEIGWTGPSVLGISLLSWLILAGTVVGLVVVAVAARMTWTYREHTGGHLLDIGLALDALFAFAIVFTGIPAVVLPPC